MTTAEQEDLWARREAVLFLRKNSELEGIEQSPDIAALEEKYMRGEISEEDFRDVCVTMAMALAPNKEWRIQLPLLE